jgi:hypothetical protein
MQAKVLVPVVAWLFACRASSERQGQQRQDGRRLLRRKVASLHSSGPGRCHLFPLLRPEGRLPASAPRQVRPRQVRLRQVRPRQVRLRQVRLRQVRLRQVPPFHDRPRRGQRHSRPIHRQARSSVPEGLLPPSLRGITRLTAWDVGRRELWIFSIRADSRASRAWLAPAPSRPAAAAGPLPWRRRLLIQAILPCLRCLLARSGVVKCRCVPPLPVALCRRICHAHRVHCGPAGW